MSEKTEASAAAARWRAVERASIKLARQRARGGKAASFSRAGSGGRATRGQGSWKKTGRQVGLLLKIHKGGRAGDSYAARQEGAVMLLSNMLSRLPSGRAAEFKLDEARHPGVNPKNLFVHLSLSRPEGHPLTAEQWKKVAISFMNDIDAAGNQFVLFEHTGTQNNHVHLIFSRAKPVGTLTSESQSFYRWRAAVRSVEASLSIQVSDLSTERPTPTPTSDRVVSAQRRASRLGTEDPFIDPRVISQCVAESTTASQLASSLKLAGIEMKKSEKSGKTTGILFRQSGSDEWLAGSSIDREFSLPKLRSRIESNRLAGEKREQYGRLNQQKPVLNQAQMHLIHRPRGG
jgi:hypothetical protein